MSHDPKPDDSPATGPRPSAEEAQAAPAEQAPAEPELAPPPGPAERIGELEGQIKDLTDRLLRAHAEMDNMRKRGERERAETAKYAITRFAQDVVSIGDNLQRAMTAVPADGAEASPALKALRDGVAMTERELVNVLGRHGITRIDPLGDLFNPHQHQAVMKQQRPDVAAGTVIQVFQVGYAIEERVLRPAMVVVAEGGFKPVKAPPASEAEKPGPGTPAADA
jgi:molecular chaperone GrpE